MAFRRSPVRSRSGPELIRGLRPRTPYTVTRSRLRPLAPFRWLAALASCGLRPRTPYSLSRSALRRLAPFARLASLRSLASSSRALFPVVHRLSLHGAGAELEQLEMHAVLVGRL